MTSSKLEQLLKQQEQLKARIQQEKQKEVQAQRKAENRRKLLAGVALLSAIKAGHVEQRALDQLLDQYITTPRDREFLGLPPAQPAAPGNEQLPGHGAPQ